MPACRQKPKTAWRRFYANQQTWAAVEEISRPSPGKMRRCQGPGRRLVWSGQLRVGGIRSDRQKKGRPSTPAVICVPASHQDSGTKTAAPNQVLQRRVKTRSPSAEEAESRPSCGLVLCTSSLSSTPLSRGTTLPPFRERGLEMTINAVPDFTMYPAGGNVKRCGQCVKVPHLDDMRLLATGGGGFGASHPHRQERRSERGRARHAYTRRHTRQRLDADANPDVP